MGKVIGIDLGTTNSCVSVIEGGKPIVVPSQEGGRTTPSIVGFGKANQRLVGQLAKRQAVTNAENTIYSIKRFIGRRWDDTEIERNRVPYRCVKGRDDTVNIQIRNQSYTPQEISAMILQKLKTDAENFLGEPVTQAVITTPAYFTDAQRQATKDAGTIAGLEVLRIINEPTAAALAYGLDKQDQEQYILVYDLGGGTFDVSILEIGNGIFEVKATSGNNHLGGDDIDNIIVSWLVQNFKEKEGIDLSSDKMAIQRLREASEKAKIELSSLLTTSINLPFITADETGPKHLETELTRSVFEDLTHDLIEETLKPIKQAIKDSDISSDKIDKIILVGGSTRIPAVQKVIQGIFPNTALDRSVNPDEAVALGAAIQGGILGGEVEDVLLLEVTPLSLGIETLGEVFTKVIERNTTIPTSKFQIFSTATDGQTSVEIHVLQGERAMAKDNKSLGKFEMTGIPPSPRGVPQIEVSFEIDVNGILKVAAQDKGTGKKQSIQISNTGGLSAKEIERMQQEAAAYEEQDRLRLQLVDLKNRAFNLFNDYESSVQELQQKELNDLIQDKLNALTEEINQRKAEIESAFTNPSIVIDDVKLLVDQFREKVFKIGEIIYGEASKDEQGLDQEFQLIPEDEEFKTIEEEILQELSRVTLSTPVDDEATEPEATEPEATEPPGKAEEQEPTEFDYDQDETVTGDYEAVD